MEIAFAGLDRSSVWGKEYFRSKRRSPKGSHRIKWACQNKGRLVGRSVGRCNGLTFQSALLSVSGWMDGW